MWKKIKPYVISILIALGIGAISAFLTRNNMNIYDDIKEPALSPPMSVFPIVWSILYILMGIGAALVYKNRNKDIDNANRGLIVYGIQLVVNFLWSIIFFNYRAFLFAFIWLLILWFLIIVMIRLFKKISPFSAYLQIPYLLWVTFAGYLTLMVYILNR